MSSRLGTGLGPNITAALGLGLQGNYSLFAVPAAWVIAMIPGFYALKVFNDNKYPGQADYDLSYPDGNLNRRTALPADKYALFARARGAHSNGIINLPLFAGALILGHVARLPAEWLNSAAVSYLGFRTAYVYFYLTCDTNRTASRRSLCWTGSSLVSMAIFVAAGLKLKEGY